MTASAAIASWRPRTVPEEAAAFAREVVARAAPTSRARAKALLFAASRAAGFSLDVGLELRPEVVFCPTVIERFIVANARAFSAPTARTLRTNCRALGRALQAYPEPAPVRLPRERAKKPYTASEISAYLALADAQPNPSRRMRPRGSSAWERGPAWSAPTCRAYGAATWPSARAAWWWRWPADERARSRSWPISMNACWPPPPLPGRASWSGGPSVRGATSPPAWSPRSRAGLTWLAWRSPGYGLPGWLKWRGLIGLGAFMGAAGVDVSQRLGDIAAGLAEVPEAQVVALLGGQAC